MLPLKKKDNGYHQRRCCLLNSLLFFFQHLKIHPLFFFIIVISIFTGSFYSLSILIFAVLLHEWGHFYAAYRFKYKIEKIELMPFGGVVQLQEYGNRPFKEEWVVILSGPIQHVWVVLIVFVFSNSIPYSDVHLTIHIALFCFNLLPIYPLDGGKILLLSLAYQKPYQQAFEQTLRISLFFLIIMTIIVLFLVPFQMNFWLMIMFLLFSIWMEWKRRFVLFQFFLFERFQQERMFKKRRQLTYPKGVSLFTQLKGLYKDCFCYYKYKGQKETKNERQLLHSYFERK